MIRPAPAAEFPLRFDHGAVGDGSNRFPAAHVNDVARLYRLALEAGKPGARYHAVAEEGILLRQIAEILGKGLGVPVKPLSTEEAQEHFG